MAHGYPDVVTSERNSRIELLKLFALFLIVLSHTAQTLCAENGFIPFDGYLLDLSAATAEPQRFLLSLFCGLGAFGNAVFFISSAWFMLDSNSVRPERIARILLSVFCVSIVFLGIMLAMRNGAVAPALIVKSLFPTTFANNWYLTCYVLFYAAHPLLNAVIHMLSRRQLLLASLILTALYLGAGFLYRGAFFGTELMIWLAIYFVLAYVKQHLPETADSLKANAVLLACCAGGHIALLILTDVIGLKVPAFGHLMLHWSSNASPLMILAALAAFCLAKRKCFSKRFVNKLAGLALPVYIIHENILVRTYVRPAALEFIWERFGYSHILMWVIALSAAVFIVSAVLSLLFSVSLGRIIDRAAKDAVKLCKKLFARLDNAAVKLR